MPVVEKLPPVQRMEKILPRRILTLSGLRDVPLRHDKSDDKRSSWRGMGIQRGHIGKSGEK